MFQNSIKENYLTNVFDRYINCTCKQHHNAKTVCVRKYFSVLLHKGLCQNNSLENWLHVIQSIINITTIYSTVCTITSIAHQTPHKNENICPCITFLFIVCNIYPLQGQDGWSLRRKLDSLEKTHEGIRWNKKKNCPSRPRSQTQLKSTNHSATGNSPVVLGYSMQGQVANIQSILILQRWIQMMPSWWVSVWWLLSCTCPQACAHVHILTIHPVMAFLVKVVVDCARFYPYCQSIKWF